MIVVDLGALEDEFVANSGPKTAFVKINAGANHFTFVILSGWPCIAFEHLSLYMQKLLGGKPVQVQVQPEAVCGSLP